MKYRVSWHPKAFARLRRSWLRANQPQAGLRAFDQIEEMLSADAHLKGESRDALLRIAFVPPIGVVFHPDQEAGEAIIVDAWMYSRRDA